MKLAKRLSLVFIMSVGIAFGSFAAPKYWEAARTEHVNASKTVMRDVEYEVKTGSGQVVVQANHPVQIKIFTILGRLVNSETVPTGTYRFQLPAHGVYIVKIGEQTCKIAV